MSGSDAELILKPLSVDILAKIVQSRECTKIDLMRSYHDLMTKTVHYRLYEMRDLGWVDIRGETEANCSIRFTSKGYDIYRAVADLIADMEAM